ncbi:MAG: histidinol-phosphate transaminase [Oscillospiraceae bacterium]
MNKYWSDRLSDVEPYVPGEQPKDRILIKLNTNENPYPPSPMVEQALRDTPVSELRLYPDPECASLRRAIAEAEGLDTDQIFIGNGSDEVLAFSFLAFFSERSEIIFPDITYSFYPVYAAIFGIKYRTIPLNSDYTVPIGKFLETNDGIVIANPNAPTSVAMTLYDIEAILRGNPDNVVIIDEAYVSFGAESAVRLISKYPNLLVVRTLSKSNSLAGMRVGFALGDRGLIEAINCVKNSVNSYTLDRLALKAAEVSILDGEYTAKNAVKIINTRGWVSAKLREMGFSVPESKANFIFISHPQKKASEIFAELRARGILVRYFPKPRIENSLRVTVGTDEQMQSLIAALDDIIQ